MGQGKPIEIPITERTNINTLVSNVAGSDEKRLFNVLVNMLPEKVTRDASEILDIVVSHGNLSLAELFAESHSSAIMIIAIQELSSFITLHTEV